MKSLRCKFGWHDWYYDVFDKEFVVRTCARGYCKKSQFWDLWNWHCEKTREHVRDFR